MKYKKIVSLLLVILGGYFAKNQAFDQSKSSQLSDFILTKHAKCRMDCRNIDLAEIKDILQNGKINNRKSNAYQKPCPTKAHEGFSKQDNQKIRVVAAYCKEAIKIVTVIDLENEYKCYCR